MSYHGRIMNIPYKVEFGEFSFDQKTHYKFGHRDARHAAAEIAAEADAVIAEMLEALEFLVDVYRDDVEQYPHGEEHIRRAMAVIAKAKGEQP